MPSRTRPRSRSAFNTGSVGLNVFQATTEAYVDGGALTAASLTVNATNNTGIFSANGSGCLWQPGRDRRGVPGPGLLEPTEAYVGDEFHYQGNGAAHTTALNLSGALDVEATTKNRFEAYAIGGASRPAWRRSPAWRTSRSPTTPPSPASGDTTLQSVTGGAAGAVTINATEDVVIKEIAGKRPRLVASGAGVGIARRCQRHQLQEPRPLRKAATVI